MQILSKQTAALYLVVQDWHSVVANLWLFFSRSLYFCSFFKNSLFSICSIKLFNKNDNNFTYTLNWENFLIFYDNINMCIPLFLIKFFFKLRCPLFDFFIHTSIHM